MDITGDSIPALVAHAETELRFCVEIIMLLGVTLFSSRPEPVHSLRRVLLHSIASQIAETDVVLSSSVLHLGSLAETCCRFDHVLLNSSSELIADPQIVKPLGLIRLVFALLTGCPEPSCGPCEVLRESLASRETMSQMELRGGVSLLGSRPKPFSRGLNILWDAFSTNVGNPKITLSLLVALFSCKAKPFHSLNGILLNPFSAGIPKAHFPLRVSVPQVSGLTVPVDGLGEVAFNSRTNTVDGGQLVHRRHIARLRFSVNLRHLLHQRLLVLGHRAG
mmetsp:Transcript_18949/g.44425  ORF Transcript_18949/g.44425 Transcript_18949/m.44425 type:complete len:278 (-) Transcript_18949:21-854(-)